MSDIVDRLKANSDLMRQWEKWELGDGPAPKAFSFERQAADDDAAAFVITSLLGEAQMSEWQPIETAPKVKNKGYEILVWCPDDDVYWLARWSGICWLAEDCMCVNPTHWMPLPPPPVERGQP